jgi:hypothetical protein
MKTYLYNRISSGKQIVGDGLLRQSESEEVLEFIKTHKLQIEKRLIYAGSSFTGKNFNNDTVLGLYFMDLATEKPAEEFKPFFLIACSADVLLLVLKALKEIIIKL